MTHRVILSQIVLIAMPAGGFTLLNSLLILIRRPSGLAAMITTGTAISAAFISFAFYVNYGGPDGPGTVSCAILFNNFEAPHWKDLTASLQGSLSLSSWPFSAAFSGVSLMLRGLLSDRNAKTGVPIPGC